MDNLPPEQPSPAPEPPIESVPPLETTESPRVSVTPLAEIPAQLPVGPTEEELRALAALEAEERERNLRRIASRKGTLLSLSVLVIAIGMIFGAKAISKSFDLEYLFKHDKGPAKLPNPLEDPSKLGIIQIAVFGSYGMLVLFGGMISLLTLLLAVLIEPVTIRLHMLFAAFPRRPFPEFNLFDFIAIFLLIIGVNLVVYMSAATLLGLVARAELMGLQMLSHDAAMAVGVLVAIAIACVRARSWFGARGFWTAWSPEQIFPVNSLWYDAALGFGCFVFSRWVLTVSGMLYQKIIAPPDDHFVVAQIAAHPKPWVLAAILFGATFGAAFFEETIYRGMLYNALRRMISAPAAAIIGSIIFATMHGFNQDLLSLFTLGIVMTWLYEKTGRLFASMVFHFSNNACAMVMLMVAYY